jgi:hypothetical protein
VLEIDTALETRPFEGETGLILLKALTCRQRRAFWELEQHGAYAGGARALYGKLKAFIGDRYGMDRRVLPLNTNVSPEEPADWEELALRYGDLARALFAWEWYQENRFEIGGPATAKEFLECIGAVQQRVFRVLHGCFKNAQDDHQRTLYNDLLDEVNRLGIYLDSLNPRRSDGELERTAAALSGVWDRLKQAVERKSQQAGTLAAIFALTDRRDLGANAADAEQLRTLLEAALDAGVPATHKELREALMPWLFHLEDDPKLAAMVTAIQNELDRRASLKAKAAPEATHWDVTCLIRPSMRTDFRNVAKSAREVPKKLGPPAPLQQRRRLPARYFPLVPQGEGGTVLSRSAFGYLPVTPV